MIPDSAQRVRRYEIGAEVIGPETVSFRVRAPGRMRVAVVVQSPGAKAEFQLHAEGDGYFSGTRTGARSGMLYSLRLDGQEKLYPDPASRFQPQGHDGPSQIVDPDAYEW